MAYVICPHTITSPAPSAAFTAATGLGADETCGERCEVFQEAYVMAFICPRGHHFNATWDDIRDGTVRPHDPARHDIEFDPSSLRL